MLCVRPTRWFRLPWLLLSCGLLATTGLVAPACSSDNSGEKAPQLGQMTLDLTATDASGARYRLRHGVFEITAFSTEQTIVVSTEDDLDAATIDLDLAADAYSVFLRPGYFLEQVSEGGEGGAPGDSDTTTTGSGGGDDDYGAASDLKRLSDLLKFRSEHPQRKVQARAPRTGAVAPTARAELPHPVDAELVSENPVMAQVTADETTRVDFVFSLEPGAGGDGELEIGIDVIGPGSTSCEPDAFEPNNSPAEAPLVSLEPPLSATACAGDEDFFLFDSPVAEGEGFRVVLEFPGDVADIDCALIDDQGNIVDTGIGVTSTEELLTISNGGQYMLYAFPFAGEASYTARVEAADDVEQSNCCSTSEFPGCSDTEVSECVCALDPFCCNNPFDQLCVQVALQQCGGTCPVGDGSCCETSEGPGCEDQETLDCVCAIDVQCCMSSYDDLCAEEAVAACGLSCEMPEPDSDCCSPGENPGCTDPAVAECTCAIDPLCCAHPFDENCVSIAAGYCDAACGGL